MHPDGAPAATAARASAVSAGDDVKLHAAAQLIVVRRIVRGEHHALELGKEPAAPPQRHPVQGDFLFPAAFLNGVGDVLLPAAVPECSLHPHDLLVKAHQIPFPYAPEAPAPGQQPDRLQQIGFPLGILPHDEVIPGVRL